MPNDRLFTSAGIPNETVTHWGISRIEKGEWQRLDYPDVNGVRIKDWPLADLTLENLRLRWSTGEFKIHWFELDPENADSKKRRISQGHSSPFTLEPEPIAATVAASPPVLSASGDSMGQALNFATALMSMSDQRANATIEAVSRLAGFNGASGASDSKLAAEVAGLRAQLEADQRQRAIDEKHRAELAEKDREIERLRREAEDVGDDGDDRPMFEPGSGSLWEQIGYGLLNAAAKKPEIVAALAGPILEKIAERQGVKVPPSMAPPRVAPPVAAPHPHPVEPMSLNASMPQHPIAQAVTVPVVSANGTPRTAARVPAPAGAAEAPTS